MISYLSSFLGAIYDWLLFLALFLGQGPGAEGRDYVKLLTERHHYSRR